MGNLAHAIQKISSVVVEREDGKQVVLRRSVEHPGTPLAVKSGSVSPVAVSNAKAPGTIRFFADVSLLSSKLRHS